LLLEFYGPGSTLTRTSFPRGSLSGFPFVFVWFLRKKEGKMDEGKSLNQKVVAFLLRKAFFRSQDFSEIQQKLQELMEAGVVSRERVEGIELEGDIIGLSEYPGGDWVISVITPYRQSLDFAL
jgi:hypothetical protein